MLLKKLQDQKIKNLLFDLGGVIVDLAPQKTKEEFKKLGMDPDVADRGEIFQEAVYLDYEVGEISDEQFRKRLSRYLSGPVTQEKFDQAWNAMLLGIPSHRIKAIQNLSQKFRCFVLSNSNAIHQRYFERQFQNQYLFPLPDLFEKVFYSHVERVRKPCPEAFQNVIRKAEITPQETLFLDDSRANLESAKEMGFKTLEITQDPFVERPFKKEGGLPS